MIRLEDNTLKNQALKEFEKFIFTLCSPPKDEWDFYKSNMSLYSLNIEDFYLKPGDPANTYAFIFEGLFKRYYLDEDGNPVIFSFDGPGQAISDLPSILREQKANMFIQAIKPSLILNTPPNFYKIIRQRHKSFEESARIITEIKFLEFVDRSLELLTLSPKDRYKSFIRKHESIFDLLQVRDIASYIGVTPETLSRIRKRI